MSKGNMFQGMARGKVGDVVFSRLDGQQITRVRNRNPRNPRTNAQLYQRAVMATIMQAYSAGKAIFDHSFQGKSVGSGCQREFMSRNANILRSLLAADINGNVSLSDAKARCVAPGVTAPVGFAGMLVSDGSYPQNLFSVTSQGKGQATYVQWALPEIVANETCAAYATRNNILAGDIYTFVGYVVDGRETVYGNALAVDLQSAQFKADFFYIRLIVKSSFVNSTEAIDAKLWSDLFELEFESPYPVAQLMSQTIAAGVANIETLLGWDKETDFAWIGLIRSRKDVDYRSKTELLNGNALSGMLPGLKGKYILDAWQAGATKVGNSSLILEGAGSTSSLTLTGAYLRPSVSVPANKIVVDASGKCIKGQGGGSGILVYNPSTGQTTFENPATYANDVTAYGQTTIDVYATADDIWLFEISGTLYRMDSQKGTVKPEITSNYPL